MGSFPEYMNEYKKQLKKGDIQLAYQGLMDYFGKLRSYLKEKYPDQTISSQIYYGYMDMTYLPFFPESLKIRGLKIAIVFLHEEFRFEVWLSGKNKDVLKKYWELIKESGWNKYNLTSPGKGIDFILDHILMDDPDFSDLELITTQIESGALKFIKDIEVFLSQHSN